MIVLNRLPCRSPAVSCTSTSGWDALTTVSGTLVNTGVDDVTGVDGVAGNAADDTDSLALAAGNKHNNR